MTVLNRPFKGPHTSCIYCTAKSWLPIYSSARSVWACVFMFVCVCLQSHSVFMHEAPDTSCNLAGEQDDQAAEELHNEREKKKHVRWHWSRSLLCFKALTSPLVNDKKKKLPLCDGDSQFPADIGTPGWHRSNRGNRRPSLRRRRRSGCGHLDAQKKKAGWLIYVVT